MRSGPFGFLICLTAAAVAAAIAAPRAERGSGISEHSGALVYPGLAGNLEDISEIRLKTPETELTFTQSGGVWRTKERGGYPADARKLTETVLALSELRYVEPKTARPDLYPRLQIEDPDAEGALSRRIRLADSDGAVLADLITGRRKLDLHAAGARGLYIRKAAETRGWLAAGGLNIVNAPENWLQAEIVDVPPARVKSAELVHRGGERAAVSRASPAAGFTAADLPKGAKAKGGGAADEIAGALENLTLRDAAAAGDVPFEPRVRVSAAFETFDGLTVELDLHKEQHEGDHPRWWAAVTAHADSGAGQSVKNEADAVNARTQGWIYRLPAWKSARLTRRRADLTETPETGASEVQ